MSFDLSVIHVKLNALLSLMSVGDAFPLLEKAYIDSFIKHATTLYQESPEQFITLWKDKHMYELACICRVNRAIDHIIYGMAKNTEHCVEWAQ